MQRVLLCTDLSAASEHAALRAMAAFGEDVQYRLVHAMLPHDVHDLPHALRDAFRGGHDRRRARAEASLHELCARLPRQCESHVAEAAPVAAIVGDAEGWRADLAVVAPHGLPLLAQALLGSTTRRVIRESPCSVLVMRGGARETSADFRRIILATDFHEPSHAAARAADRLAAQMRARLTCTFVAHPAIWGHESHVDWPARREQADSQWLDHAQQHAVFQWLRERLHVFNLQHLGGRAHEVLLEGVPHEALPRLARDEDADLLVVGTHGAGAYARATIGSVAETLAARAPCSVLVAKARAGSRTIGTL